MKSLSRVRLLATPWTAAHQAPPSMGFSRQEHWSGVPLPCRELQVSEVWKETSLPRLWEFESWLTSFWGFPSTLPGKSHGRRSLVGCSPWDCKESDTTERLHFHSSLSCIGEGNGNPLQCSCLENPRGGGAWWAAVYGVAQSRTRLK